MSGLLLLVHDAQVAGASNLNRCSHIKDRVLESRKMFTALIVTLSDACDRFSLKRHEDLDERLGAAAGHRETGGWYIPKCSI